MHLRLQGVPLNNDKCHSCYVQNENIGPMYVLHFIPVLLMLPVQYSGRTFLQSVQKEDSCSWKLVYITSPHRHGNNFFKECINRLIIYVVYRTNLCNWSVLFGSFIYRESLEKYNYFSAPFQWNCITLWWPVLISKKESAHTEKYPPLTQVSGVVIVWSHFLSRVQKRRLWYRHLESLWLHSHNPRRLPHTQPSFLLGVHISVGHHCLLGNCPHVFAPGGYQHIASSPWTVSDTFLHRSSWEAGG